MEIAIESYFKITSIRLLNTDKIAMESDKGEP
jgi:hypothetical protein